MKGVKLRGLKMSTLAAQIKSMFSTSMLTYTETSMGSSVQMVISMRTVTIKVEAKKNYVTKVIKTSVGPILMVILIAMIQTAVSAFLASVTLALKKIVQTN